MKKLKYIITIVLIFTLVGLTQIKTKADYLNIIILDNGTIEDLADEETQNTWNINKYIFASYDYNGNKQYLLNYYSTTTNYNILFTTEKFLPISYLEIEDNAGSYQYSNDLKKLLQDLNTQINLIDPYASTTPTYYIQYNYNEMIGYWNYNDNQPILYVNDYDEYYTNYINNYGILNSIYQQYGLYNKIIGYYQNVININGNTYQENQEFLNNYYQNQIEKIKQDYTTYYEEQIIETQNEYFTRGYTAGQENPIDTTDYTLNGMFKAISLYPINIFTQGLNIELFGINIGNLILGIFMIALLIIIIRMVLSIIKGGK